VCNLTRICWCHINETAKKKKKQFTFGGESACPFGTLEIGRLLLDGVLNVADDTKVQAPLFTEALQTAVGCFILCIAPSSSPITYGIV
jgi:hypothetical protein